MNKITTVTRQAIADEMQLSQIHYAGDMQEVKFLARLYDLNKLPSDDYRYSTAYDDINQHTSWNDWEDGWYLTDHRFNLLYADDEKYIRFIVETLHPVVRNNADEIKRVAELYNRHLEKDGYKLYQKSGISGRPVYDASLITVPIVTATKSKSNIKKFLDTPYVEKQINLMHDAVQSNPDEALGKAKELIETACISILNQKGVEVDKDWTIGQLLKNTNKSLDFTPAQASNAQKAEQSIQTILSGINQIVTGVTELRYAYGAGHGKDAGFVGLEPKFAQLAVDAASALVTLYLSTNGETTELIEADTSEF